MAEIVFDTGRIIVRHLVDDDFTCLHALTGDSQVMRYVGNLQPYTPEQTKQAIAEAQTSYNDNGFGLWAFVEKSTGRFMGYGGLEYLPGREIPEVAYILAPAYWGQGYASEIAQAIVNYAFHTLGLPRIGASFDPANHPSMAVARKAGLSYSHFGLDEFNLPTIFYAMDNPTRGNK